MNYYTNEQLEFFFNYMETLDCYTQTQAGMINELTKFESNPNRLIASFVCKNTTEKLTYEAPYIRILYVLTGSIKVKIDHNEFTLISGGLILANQHSKITYEETMPETAVISYYFKKSYFTDSLLTQLVEEAPIYGFFIENIKQSNDKLQCSYCRYQFDTKEDIHFYALLLLKQIVKMNYFDNKLTKAAFILFIVEINQLSLKEKVQKMSDEQSDVVINEILSHIENNLATITLGELANVFHFHPNYLSTFIKQKTNQSFSEWLVSYRLYYAKNYLMQTDISVQEIITTLGYSDKTTFFKLFKQKYKMTPGEYRRKYRI